MKKLMVAFIFFIVGFWTGGAYAQEVATVENVSPRYVTVYRRVCEPVDGVTRKSDIDPLIGGVVGGIAGHQIGNGSGQTAATIIGAIVGQNIARNIKYGPRCWEEPFQEQRGSVVTFRYKGRLFSHTFTE